MDFLNSAAVISLCRLDRYLSLNGNNILNNIAESYGNADVSEFSEYISDNPEDFSESKKRYIRILDFFDEKFRDIAGNFIDFSVMLRCIPDIPDNFTINIDTLLKVNNIKISDYSFVSEFINQLQKLIPVSENRRSVLKTEICSDSRFVSFLSGSDIQESIIKNICSIFSKNSDMHILMINEEICGTASLMMRNRKSVINITGKAHTGKKFILKHAARNTDRELLFIDFRLLMRYSAEDISEALWNIKREAVFYDRIVCWHNLDKKILALKNWEISEFVKLCIENFINDGIQICICSDDFIDFSYSIYPVNTIKLNDADESQRIKLWKGFCDIYGFQLEYGGFAMRYKLSAGQISEVFRKKLHGCYDESLSETRIFDMICSESGCCDDGLLHLRCSDYTFDDLKIPEFQMNTLKQICKNFENSYTVYNRWDMKRKFPYGRGLSVLLTGPPGTGKTMTACVMANTLRLPLYQADMSQITDKYIGETEKNIDALFEEAEKRNCVLFLDEADSLCGKRSEINDSKDKYANNDTAFVLQRIESFDGIVILATNYINNIDSAFMRRMKYVIQFSVPDAKIRYQIWKSSFTEKVAVSSDVDFQYLAEQFEFSGSNIKNIVLASVFLSASENTPVNMKHILTSVYNEYLKQQRHMFAVEFGKYEELYNQIVK